MQGLYRQGILGFYKGNAMRMTHILFYEMIRNNVHYFASMDENILKGGSYFMLEYASALFASMFLHPIHFAESRLVLNNRLPNFNSYKSLYTLMLTNRMNNGVYRGWTTYIPINFVLAFSGYNYSNSSSPFSYLSRQLLCQTLIYPLVTILRRLEC